MARHHWPEILHFAGTAIVYATLQPRPGPSNTTIVRFRHFHPLPAGNSILSWFPYRAELCRERLSSAIASFDHSSLRVAQTVSRQVALCFRLFQFTSLQLCRLCCFTCQIPVMSHSRGLTVRSRLVCLSRCVLPSFTMQRHRRIGQTALALLIVCVVLVGFATFPPCYRTPTWDRQSGHRIRAPLWGHGVWRHCSNTTTAGHWPRG